VQWTAHEAQRLRDASGFRANIPLSGHRVHPSYRRQQYHDEQGSFRETEQLQCGPAAHVALLLQASADGTEIGRALARFDA
jgi:hypothetical protein